MRIHPDLYEQGWVVVMHGKLLLVQGRLQNQDSVVHVKAQSLVALGVSEVKVRAQDFH